MNYSQMDQSIHTMDHADHSGHHDHGNVLENSEINEQSPLDDHSHHDMSGHNHQDMMQHMMSMAFHGGFNETILFTQWRTSSIGGLLWSMLVIFVMAALYEGLKYYREYLFWKTYNALQYRAVTVPEKGVVAEESARVVAMVGEVIHKQPPSMFSLMHVYQSILHVLQVTLSFFLMLIFMTYNSWLCLAVVSGATLGYFLFGWKKSVIVDVTEHCH